MLDLGLPGISGLDVVRGLRGALDAGADDYVTKPFGINELVARLRAGLRRAVPAEEAPVVATGHLTVGLSAKKVKTAAGEVRLMPTEGHIVGVLVRHRGKLVSQRQLLQEVWGPQYESETNYLRLFLAQIRRKLGPNAQPRYFVTEPGMGYRFEPG